MSDRDPRYRNPNMALRNAETPEQQMNRLHRLYGFILPHLGRPSLTATEHLEIHGFGKGHELYPVINGLSGQQLFDDPAVNWQGFEVNRKMFTEASATYPRLAGRLTYILPAQVRYALKGSPDVAVTRHPLITVPADRKTWSATFTSIFRRLNTEGLLLATTKARMESEMLQKLLENIGFKIEGTYNPPETGVEATVGTIITKDDYEVIIAGKK